MYQKNLTQDSATNNVQGFIKIFDRLLGGKRPFKGLKLKKSKSEKIWIVVISDRKTLKERQERGRQVTRKQVKEKK